MIGKGAQVTSDSLVTGHPLTAVLYLRVKAYTPKTLNRTLNRQMTSVHQEGINIVFKHTASEDAKLRSCHHYYLNQKHTCDTDRTATLISYPDRLTSYIGY